MTITEPENMVQQIKYLISYHHFPHMKLPILSLLLLLIYATAGSQNYGLVLPGKLQYYANSRHYIRAARVDSVTVNGTGSVYHLFATPRGNYMANATLDTEGGSWLGKIIITKADGTILIPGYYGDTAKLKTQATPGDKWVFYESCNYKAQATVIDIDTLSIGGSTDSIKTIMLTTNDTTDILHGCRIVISKHNGIIQTPDLYLFPQNKAGTDYFFDEATNHSPDKQNIIFKQTDFENPDILDIYDYDTGNIFLTRHTVGIQGINQPPSFTLEHITDKKTSGHSTTYTVTGWRQNYYPPAPTGYYTQGYTGTLRYLSGQLHDTDYLPEEYGSRHLLFQDLTDTQYCTKGMYMSRNNLLHYGGTGVQVANAEPNTTTLKYKKGLGVVYRYDYHGSGAGATDEYTKTAIYKGFPCGDYPKLSVKRNTPEKPKIQIYPNPAHDRIYIKLPEQGEYQIALTNTLGQSLMQTKATEDTIEIDTRDLPVGIYGITISDQNNVTISKVLIGH